MKAPFIIYSDVDCLLEKMHSCQNNPEKSYTRKKLSIRLLITHCLQIVHLIQRSCTQQKTILTVTKVKTVWKKRFCKNFREHTVKKLTMKKKKKFYHYLMKKISLMKSKNFVTYVKKNLVLVKTIKIHLNYTEIIDHFSLIKDHWYRDQRSKIIIMTLKNLEGLLIIFVI